MSEPHTKENPLGPILNEQLSSVIFVQDYLQLDFDGNVLTCYQWPKVISGKKKFVIDDRDYRNELCKFIGKIVKNVAIKEEEELAIFFGDNLVLRLSLSYNDPSIIEIAMFVDVDEKWSVF